MDRQTYLNDKNFPLQLTFNRRPHITYVASLKFYWICTQWTFQYTCSIKTGTALIRVIQEGKATVVDKALTMNKVAFEALDRTLRDLTGKDRPMGGMCMLLCGGLQTELASNSGWY